MTRDKKQPGTPRPTFGESLAASGVERDLSTLTRALVDQAIVHAKDVARIHLKVISCDTCLAPKGCCKIAVAIGMHEAALVAARLVRDGRDTPALRDRLLDSAIAMETIGRSAYFQPCVLLDYHERCTVYEDRPFACGAALAYSPPERCSAPAGLARVDAPDHAHLETARRAHENLFVDRMGLPREGFPYVGVLPRMVLLCLQAWGRRDYPRFLAEGARASWSALRAMT